MASRFNCDPQKAQELSGQLASIQSDLQEPARYLNQDFDGAAIGSQGVAAALDVFSSATAQTHADLDTLLEKTSGLLGGLAEGTEAVDGRLSDLLGPLGKT